MQTIPEQAKRYAQSAETSKGVKLRLIGYWVDLAAYYEGDDGNAYSCGVTGRFSNCGEIGAFRSNFKTRFRGELFA